VGVVDDLLMVRVGPERYEEALSEAHVRPMDFTGSLLYIVQLTVFIAYY